jgi:hypothetical protein
LRIYKLGGLVIEHDWIWEGRTVSLVGFFSLAQHTGFSHNNIQQFILSNFDQEVCLKGTNKTPHGVFAEGALGLK